MDLFAGTRPQRIVIVGTTGTGKSELARRLAAILGHEIIELDDLHWQPGWRQRPEQEFLTAVATATARPAWILVGNYPRTWKQSWPRAELVLWLDCGFVRTLVRLSSGAASRARGQGRRSATAMSRHGASCCRGTASCSGS